MVALPDFARALIDGKNFATFGTVQPDGSPQLSVVWVARDGDDVLISTLAGRRKHANLLQDPRATVLITPADNAYAYVEIRGTATLTTEGGPELINDLSLKYVGQPYTNDGPDDVRVVVRVTPGRVVQHD